MAWRPASTVANNCLSPGAGQRAFQTVDYHGRSIRSKSIHRRCRTHNNIRASADSHHNLADVIYSSGTYPNDQITTVIKMHSSLPHRSCIGIYPFLRKTIAPAVNPCLLQQYFCLSARCLPGIFVTIHLYTAAAQLAHSLRQVF